MDGKLVRSIWKETIMSSMKILLAAASLAVLSAAGIGAASAAPWNNWGDHGRYDGWHDRAFERHERFEHRAYVDRIRLMNSLRFPPLPLIGGATLFPSRRMIA